MYVCICNQVSDHQIRREVRAGADSLREVRRRLGVASQCGRCAGCAREVITATQAEVKLESIDFASDLAAPMPA